MMVKASLAYDTDHNALFYAGPWYSLALEGANDDKISDSNN